jgi:ribonucleoside-diphosphate reductase alpha chain
MPLDLDIPVTNRHIGPRTLFSQQLHREKYRHEGESFDDFCVRYARTVAQGESEAFFYRVLDMLRDQRFLPGGRQQRAVGRPFQLTAHNCYVSPIIGDSMTSIMQALTAWAMTLRMGGGIGGDFSRLRPAGSDVYGLGEGARASGPVSFMDMFCGMSRTIMSAGERRGAMMAELRCDHPDILKFIRCKAIPDRFRPLWEAVAAMPAGDQKKACEEALQLILPLQQFNITVCCTDLFMEAVVTDGLYELRFGERSYGKVRALDVWGPLMENNWDVAEPGVAFLDTINRENNLWYCETLEASNPCGEQFLPPDGACLLASQNLVKYQREDGGFEDEQFVQDAKDVNRALDNVIDRSEFPREEQKEQQRLKRRMGVGVTGLANVLEAQRMPYGSDSFCEGLTRIFSLQRDALYEGSCELAEERGSFPLLDAEKYLQSGFAKRLPEHIRDRIARKGIRNSLLSCVAPNATISMAADNPSAGIEPTFSHVTKRPVMLPSGTVMVELQDYAFANWGVAGKTAYEVSAQDHIKVLCATARMVDNSVSKTCNVFGRKPGMKLAGGVSFEDFKELYVMAWKGGAKSCTTFNINGQRAGILQRVEQAQKKDDPGPAEGERCTIDIATGARSCEG